MDFSRPSSTKQMNIAQNIQIEIWKYKYFATKQMNIIQNIQIEIWKYKYFASAFLY